MAVQAEIIGEDERYPMLVVYGETWTRGYDINLSTGELRRICVCHAHYSSECVCGAWDLEEEEVLGGET